MGLKDNWFRENNPAAIIAKVAEISLAEISKWDQRELDRLGWLNNPAVDRLYSLTSAGVWIARTKTDGSVIIDSDLRDYTNYTELGTRLSYPPSYNGTRPSSGTEATYKIRRIIPITLGTDGAGAAAAVAAITAPAGHYPVCRLMNIHSTVAEATTQLLVTVTGGALIGPSRIDLNLGAYVPQAFNSGQGQLLMNLTDASVINLAINSGPISATIVIEIEYWFET